MCVSVDPLFLPLLSTGSLAYATSSSLAVLVGVSLVPFKSAFPWAKFALATRFGDLDLRYDWSIEGGFSSDHSRRFFGF